MKNSNLLFFSIVVAVLAMLSCTNSGKKHVYSVDEIFVCADSLVNDTIEFEGLCTHLCKHSGRRAFLRGSNPDKTFRVESGSLGRFEPECINNTLRVRGIIKAVEIPLDLNENEEKHGVDDEGCETEKKSLRKYYAQAVSYEIIKKQQRN